MCCHNVFRRVGHAIKKGARKAAKFVLPLAGLSLAGGGTFGSIGSIGKGAATVGKTLGGSITGLFSGVKQGVSGGDNDGVINQANSIINQQNAAIKKQNEMLQSQEKNLSEERKKTKQYLTELGNERADNMVMMNKVVNAGAGDDGSGVLVTLGAAVYAISKFM